MNVTKIILSRCQILMYQKFKMYQIQLGAHSAPQTPSWIWRGKEKRERNWEKWGGREREMERRWDGGKGGKDDSWYLGDRCPCVNVYRKHHET